ncbi:micronuclear linker histone polyprotein isoform X2 [Eurosta solidaginis]
MIHDNQAIHVNDIETLYYNDAAEDDWKDFEEAEEASENAPDIDELVVTTIEERKSFIESNEAQDILNATLPVLKEHQRKWESAGLNQILDTFDSARIEEQVGGWLKRNHSISQQHNRYTTATDSDESGSLLSSETADYIRTARKKSHSQQRRSCIGSIGRLKKFRKIHHNHRTIIETTTYRAYNCNCGKYNSNCGDRSSEPFADTNRRSASFKKKCGILEQRERIIMNRECSSSSDADDVSYQNRTLSRAPKLFNHKHSALVCHKALHIGDRDGLISMIDTKFKTPPRSSINKLDFTKTAPSRLNQKRRAAVVAMQKLCDKDMTKLDATQVSQNVEDHSSTSEDADESFKRNLELAIALSMKTLKISRKKNTHLEKKSQRDSSSNSRSSISSVANGYQRKPLNDTKSSQQKPMLSDRIIDNEDMKENTFFANLGNVCNSTALNSAMAKLEITSVGTRKIRTSPSSSNSDSSLAMGETIIDVQNNEHSKNQNMPLASQKLDAVAGTHKIVNNPGLQTQAKRNSIGSVKKSAAGLNNFKVFRKKDYQSDEPKCIYADQKTEENSSDDNDATFKNNLDTVVTASMQSNKKKQKATPLFKKNRRDSSSNSFRSTVSSSSTDKMTTLNTSTIKLPQNRTSSISRKLKHNKEDTKESTFLTNQGNICNSTALNNAVEAVRQQLPIIAESIEKQSEETPKKSIRCITNKTDMQEIRTSKITCNTYHSTALSKSTVNKKLVVPHAATPQKQQRNSITSGRRSEIRNVKNVDKKLNRILVYKPSLQSEHISNGNIKVTQEMLNGIIGVKNAARFFKHNLKQLTFPKTSTIYFCPPKKELSSSDSEDDPVELAGLCGELCASD